MTDIAARGYASPGVLVSTDWVADHLTDPTVRIIESNEDTLLYASGHVPGAVHVDWTHDLNDQVRRDYVGREAFNAPAAPDEVRSYYVDQFKKQGVDAVLAGNSITGKSKDGGDFTIDVSPAAKGSQGKIVIHDKD